ncbi:unnamed protein product [Dovyalis caffra]|uniref:MATH domain-containing protein n=1 Tax=Dovyalis caffra TaxID=77055 RepID=A0AAV1RSP5_9ROSI|nr:unnamed protein product [Dovyalis caffra]
MKRELDKEDDIFNATTDKNGKQRFRKLPPAHYTFEIESFSSLLKTKMENYETKDFEVDGYKWRMVLYPNRKSKKEGGSRHISLFLAVTEPAGVSFGWEVNISATFFVFDGIRDRYLAVQDADQMYWRFHKFKTEWGFLDFLSHDTLRDPSNGFLLDDRIILGVEGDSNPSGTHLSLYLHLDDSESLHTGRKLYAKWSLRIKNCTNRNHYEKEEAEHWFDSPGQGFGCIDFMLLSTLKDPSMGYLVNDCMIIEAEFNLISVELQIAMKRDTSNATIDKNGKQRFRKLPPAHYTFEIESFSSLLETKVEKYETKDFEAGGYKWRMVLYPNGKNKEDGSRHISLFLALAEPAGVSFGWELNVTATFFVLDRTRDRHLAVQDADQLSWRFHKFKAEWGVLDFLSHQALHDPSNGFLVDNRIVLGVEVFVIKFSGAGESLSFVKEPAHGLYTWTIDNFSTLDKNLCFSDVFIVEGTKWCVLIFCVVKAVAFA